MLRSEEKSSDKSKYNRKQEKDNLVEPNFEEIIKRLDSIIAEL